MPHIVTWNTVSKDRWTYTAHQKTCTMLVYRLTSLPNFTDHRFHYLSKDVDQRGPSILNRQLLMLRQLHTLGDGWACIVFV